MNDDEHSINDANTNQHTTYLTASRKLREMFINCVTEASIFFTTICIRCTFLKKMGIPPAVIAEFHSLQVSLIL
jgi:hypothetical protein